MEARGQHVGGGSLSKPPKVEVCDLCMGLYGEECANVFGTLI